MRFTATRLSDAYVIDQEPVRDARGAFARTFCTREFAAHGLETSFVQHSLSQNTYAGTVRGMHFQRAPHAETKVVRCVRGAIFDVIVDVRPGSPSFAQWFGVELSASNGRALYIPAGFAHGFQTLQDETDIAYLISAFHEPTAAAGYRYDDPAFGIGWPLPPKQVSDKDHAWPPFQKAAP